MNSQTLRNIDDHVCAALDVARWESVWRRRAFIVLFPISLPIWLAVAMVYLTCGFICRAREMWRV